MTTNTLDNLILTYGKPDLLKVDVEGYECEVVKGLTQKVDEICFEWAEEEFHKTNMCVEYLKTLGFTLFGFTHEDRPVRPDVYTDWELLEIHEILQPERQLAWGMIWAK